MTTMTRLRIVTLAAGVLVSACGGDRVTRVSPVTLVCDNDCTHSVTVRPASVTLRVGDTLTFHASTTGAAPNPSLQWTSLDTTALRVDSTGFVRAAGVSPGAGLCVTTGGARACATVIVTP
jgi:uncharacterized protein YjdB